MKDTVVYVGHSYHQKTQSTKFFLEILEKKYNVINIPDYSWAGKPFPNLDFIDHNHKAVIFFQNFPNHNIINKLKNRNIIFIPMYDREVVRKFPLIYWKMYKKIKIINFSRTLHDKLSRYGMNTKYFQFFPKPKKIKMGRQNSIFFWQRTNDIDINIIDQLLPNNTKYNINIHIALDPGYHYKLPPKNLLSKYKITTSHWMRNKNDLLKKIEKSAIYFAPRKYEGIGLSFLEAMAMGRVVIGPNTPTMNEYIKDGITGYLYQLPPKEHIDLVNIKKIQIECYKYMSNGYNNWINSIPSLLKFINE